MTTAPTHRAALVLPKKSCSENSTIDTSTSPVLRASLVSESWSKKRKRDTTVRTQLTGTQTPPTQLHGCAEWAMSLNHDPVVTLHKAGGPHTAKARVALVTLHSQRIRTHSARPSQHAERVCAAQGRTVTPGPQWTPRCTTLEQVPPRHNVDTGTATAVPTRHSQIQTHLTSNAHYPKWQLPRRGLQLLPAMCSPTAQSHPRPTPTRHTSRLPSRRCRALQRC